MENPLSPLFLKTDEKLFLSPEGLKIFRENYDPQNPNKNLLYTTDYTTELPIITKKSGPGSEPPLVITQFFEESIKKFAKRSALRVKREGQWVRWTYEEFHRDVTRFAKGLISLGINRHKAMNIIGYNAPEWVIAFYSGFYSAIIPIGVYTTNGPEACLYVAEHSEAEVAVVENEVHLQKYVQNWDKLPNLKYIIVYDGNIPKNLPQEYKERVLLFKDVLKRGDEYKPKSNEETLEARKALQKPGKCCTLVYTSGTTGNPKGVILSHDNYVWTVRKLLEEAKIDDGPHRIVSYLPLSHVAGQMVDLFCTVTSGAEITFADSSALQGSLINYLKEVRPTIFFSVPRVWEKIEEQMKKIAAANGPVKTALATWAKKQGLDGTIKELQGESTSISYKLAKKVVFNNVKKALGLDEAKYLVYGAAPLSNEIREYFLSLNFFLINTYGMSENSGPVTWQTWYPGYKANMKSAGPALRGVNLLIYSPDKDGEGEICFRGRNCFSGYFKNEEETIKSIDKNRYVHSGDLGKVDQYGNLLITGRIKELLITAGGENVAPVPIEEEVKKELPFASNAVVIGDKRKYLVVLLTLKHVEEGGQPGNKITPDVANFLKNHGIENPENIDALFSNKKFIDLVQAGLDKANKKAVSRATYIRKFAFLKGDFSINGGEFTPTMKLKRNVVQKRYEKEIEALYLDPKL